MKNLQPLSYFCVSVQGSFCPHTLIFHSTGSSNDAMQHEKLIKVTKFGKEEVQVSLIAGNMIVSTEKAKETTKEVIELMSEFSKVAE